MVNRDISRRGSELPSVIGDQISTVGGLQPAEFTAERFGFSELAEYFRIVRKRKGTLIVFAFLGALVGLICVLPQTPIYRASTSIEIQAQNEDFFYSKDINPNSNMGAAYPEIDIATQTKVLETKALQNRVISRLEKDETLQIKLPEDRFAEWRKALRLPARPEPSRKEVLAETAASVRIAPSRTSRVIEITSDSPDPRLAAVFANTMASEYIEQSLETRWQSVQHTGEWLGRQLDEMKIKLQKSEEELQTYAGAMNLVLTGDKDKANVADEKLRQLQAQLSDAHADRAAKQARYEMAVTGQPESLAQVLDDGTLRTYDVKLADLRRELAELSATLTPAHYRVQRVQAQINEMEADEKKARDRIVERIYNDYKEATAREKLLSTDFQTQSALVSNQAGRIIHYNILEREVETNRQLYESLLQKVKEAGISSALRASNIQIIDPAQPAGAPFSPNIRFGIILGLLTGLSLGAGLVLIRERVNRDLELPGDAAFYLGVPELGVIPSGSVDRKAVSVRTNLRLTSSREGSADMALATFQHGQSLMAEAFRVILTSILFVGRRQPAQVIVVSSPGSSEGKTTVLCNLAMAFAETARSVLIIDGDMRRPRLHDIFGVENNDGLAGLLAEREPLEPRSLVLRSHKTAVPGVCVLPSGNPGNATANLLHSPRLGELVALARQQFDIVLFDTPPMLHLADSRVVGSLADGVILVVRSGQTSRDSALAARRQLAEDGIPIIGVTLNDWNPKVAGYYSSDTYANYYSSYYAKPKQ